MGGGVGMLTTGSDSFVGTAKNDLFTSANGTLAANDTILDSSTTDHDILNIETTSTTGVAARVQNIETINANGTYVAVGYDATSTSGTKDLNLSTSIVGGTANVTAASSINVANIKAGANIANLNVDSAAGGTRDTVNVDGGSATNVNVTGIASGIDKYNVTIADKATLKVTSAGSLSEYTANVGATATINAVTGANTKTFTINAAADSVVTANAVLTSTAANFGNTDFNGAGNVTLKVAAATTALKDQSITSTGTGKLTVEAAGAAVAADDYSNIKADTLKLTTAQANAFKVNENTVVNLAAAAGNTGAATIDVDNGTSTSIAAGAGTLNLEVSQSQTSFNTGAAVGTLLVKATPDNVTDTKDGATITIGNLTAHANTTTIVASGSEALTLTDLTHAEDLVLTSTQMTGKLVVADTSSAADKDLTIIGGTNDDKVTMTVVSASAETNNIILAGAGNDTIIVKGAGSAADNIVKVYGEAGDDKIDASALGTGAKEIILDGGAGNDTIIGSALVDTINGGAGDDIINGGDGADKITLGTGNDTVIIDSNEGGDIISDAVIGEDTIILRGAANNTAALNVAALTVTAGDYAAKLGTNHAFTLKDSTATDLSNLVQFGDATTAYAITATQDFTAGSKNDVVTVGTTSKKINLGAGDDKITVTGAVTGEIAGGAGSDTFVIGADAIITDFGATDILKVTTGAVGVTVIESFNATAATVNAAATTTLTLNQGVDVDMTLATISGTNGYTIKTATAGDYKLTDGATITGSAGDDIITGSDFADIITGGEGADIITGGKGGDTINLTENIPAADLVNVAVLDTAVAANFAALATAATISASQTTVGMDVITGFAAGDTIQLSSATAIITSTTLLTEASVQGADTTGDVTLMQGTYDSVLNTFVGDGTGNDSMLVYDTNGTTAGGTYEGIVLVGYVDATANDTISVAGLFTAV